MWSRDYRGVVVLDLFILCLGWAMILVLLVLALPKKKKALNLKQRLMAAYLTDAQEIRL